MSNENSISNQIII